MIREASDIEALKGAKVDEPLTLRDGTSLRAVPDPHGTGCSRCPLEKGRECPPSLRWSCVDSRRSFLPGLPEGFDKLARANGYVKLSPGEKVVRDGE